MELPNKRLIDYYGNARKSGIFSDMIEDSRFDALFNFIGYGKTNVHSLDFDYIYRRSGLKTVSLLLQRIYTGVVVDLDNEFVKSNSKQVVWDYIITEMDKQLINDVIAYNYESKWYKICSALSAKYDILKPYSTDVTDTLSSKLDSTNKRDSSSESSSTETIKEKGDEKTSKYSYGNEGELTDGLTSFNDTDDTVASNNKVNDSSTYGRTVTDTRSIKRVGNIGNMSSQDLILKELEVARVRVLEIVYRDLDNILTSKKYL